MGKVDILRRKYPRFIYEGYSWKILNKDLIISFDFRILPAIKFKPTVVIKNINKERIRRIGDRVLNPVRNRKFLNGVNNLVFNLGLIELLSYWKATCSPEIIIEAGVLNQEQIKWWKDLIMNGMGQFFYENKIDFTRPNFFKISSIQNKNKTYNTNPTIVKNVLSFNRRVLVPIGGGKDSIVTLELLKNRKKNIYYFSLNPNEITRKIIKVSGYGNQVIVERGIDRKLIELNRKGFLNGHTPFSAYLAFLSSLLAVIYDTKYIAFSNERSSNEGNLEYLPCTETKSLVQGLGKPRTRTSSVRGLVINHQYSKGFDFEEKFRKYSKKYLAKNLEYFSFLRPLYEIQIAKLFSKYPKYFNYFLSCNEAFKTSSGRKKITGKWCGKCPKCLFVFTALYPFIKKSELLKIFRKNLFEDKKLLPTMLRLIGEEKIKPRSENLTMFSERKPNIAKQVKFLLRGKPFECVGTKKESLIAFYLSWKKNKEKLPYLLEYFENKILPKYLNLEKEVKKIMNSWDKENNLNNDFKRILKSNLL